MNSLNDLIYLKDEVILGIDLNIISFLAILSSILVISTNNAVISVLFLISLFINVAIYLVLMGITFVGLIYVVVYVGAVTILFLFVIMLLDIKFSEIKDYNSGIGGDSFPLGLIIGITFLYPIINILPKEGYNIKEYSWSIFNIINNLLIGDNKVILTNNSESYTNIVSEISNSNIGKFEDLKVIYNLWDNSLNSYIQISGIGQVMYNSHLMWFIVVSLILLLSMVGAIALTLKSRV
jgi:NADH-ubiquinone oxidoreductase chain 6